MNDFSTEQSALVSSRTQGDMPQKTLFSTRDRCKLCNSKIPHARKLRYADYCTDLCTDEARKKRRRKRVIIHENCLICNEPITKQRQRYGAKYCPYPKKCSKIARDNRQDENNRLKMENTINSAAAYDFNNPQYFKDLRNIAEKCLDNQRLGITKGTLTFRLIQDLARFYMGWKINNNYQRYFREKLEEAIPALKFVKSKKEER